VETCGREGCYYFSSGAALSGESAGRNFNGYFGVGSKLAEVRCESVYDVDLGSLDVDFDDASGFELRGTEQVGKGCGSCMKTG
jgi:hypothetical protein